MVAFLAINWHDFAAILIKGMTTIMSTYAIDSGSTRQRLRTNDGVCKVSLERANEGESGITKYIRVYKV